MARKRKKRRQKKKDLQQVELLPELATTDDPPEEQVEVSGSEGPEAAPGKAEPVSPDGEQGGQKTTGQDQGSTSSEARPAPADPDAAEANAPEVPPPPRPQGNQLARARDLVEAGRIEDAIAQYLAILEENPTNLRAHNNLGVLLDELGQHGTAVAHFESALEVDENNVEVLTNLGASLTGLARFDEADAVVTRALRLSPDDPAGRLALGILSFRRGLYAQAETELGWVCDRDPGLGEAFYYRAEALNRTSRFEEATELMLQASELLPNDARPFYTLGHLYDRQGRPHEAAEMYRRARDLQAS